jgi:hypothetical protein
LRHYDPGNVNFQQRRLGAEKSAVIAGCSAGITHGDTPLTSGTPYDRGEVLPVPASGRSGEVEIQ